jgi:hypothetical protein
MLAYTHRTIAGMLRRAVESHASVVKFLNAAEEGGSAPSQMLRSILSRHSRACGDLHHMSLY